MGGVKAPCACSIGRTAGLYNKTQRQCSIISVLGLRRHQTSSLAFLIGAELSVVAISFHERLCNNAHSCYYVCFIHHAECCPGFHGGCSGAPAPGGAACIGITHIRFLTQFLISKKFFRIKINLRELNFSVYL